MRKIKIKPELLSLLTSEAFRRFSSQALIAAYKKLPTSANLNQRQVQQFIFRNLDRLVWAGMAMKEDDNQSRNANYRLTEIFKPSNYIVGTPHYKGALDKTTEPKSGLEDPLLDLRDQLSSHKLELLTTIAETEEYEQLCKLLPSRQIEIQELYNDARNRYSKTLGKVKAIESLISRAGS